MVYVFLADGFEEIEAITVIDVLRRGGITVETISITKERTVMGAHGVPVIADGSLSNVHVDRADMIVLPGGMPGTKHLGESETLKGIIEEMIEADKYVSAICAAPSVLGQMGLLKGKNATCYPGFEKELNGANHLTDEVVQDGKITTSRGPGTAMDFAYHLVDILKGQLESNTLKRGMIYRQTY